MTFGLKLLHVFDPFECLAVVDAVGAVLLLRLHGGREGDGGGGRRETEDESERLHNDNGSSTTDRRPRASEFVDTAAGPFYREAHLLRCSLPQCGWTNIGREIQSLSSVCQNSVKGLSNLRKITEFVQPGTKYVPRL